MGVDVLCVDIMQNTSSPFKEKRSEDIEDASRKQRTEEDASEAILGIEGELSKKRKEDVGGSSQSTLGGKTHHHLDFSQHLNNTRFFGQDVTLDASHLQGLPNRLR